MRHAVYLPTNRPAVQAIEEVAVDAAAIAAVTAEAPPLVVVEHLDGPWTLEHRAALSRAQAEHGLPVVHLTVSHARALIGEVLRRASLSGPTEWLMRALLPSHRAYGAGPNKMALLAAALGVDALHRRDSDVGLDRRGEDLVTPGTLEAQAIGRPADEVLSRAGASSDPVRIVASSYFGDPPLDRRDLFRAGWRFARDAEALLDSADTEEGLDRALTRYFLIEPATRHDRDLLEPDSTGRSDMGVCCTLGLHRQLPEMPALATIGCDYMQRNLASQLRMPVVWHSRKVEHRYGPDRTSADRQRYVVEYAMSEARLVLLWSAWAAHNEAIAADPDSFGDSCGKVDQVAYAASFRDALGRRGGGFADLVARYAAVHRRAAAVAPAAEGQRLAAVAAAVERDSHKLAESVRHSITQYAALVETWPALIAAATTMHEAQHLWT